MSDQDFFKAERKLLFPLLDQYKQAWVTLHDYALVTQKKEELRKKVEEELESGHPGMLKSFDNQTWQIENRWLRPAERSHSIN